MIKPLTAALAVALLSCATPSWAGRPLESDDATTTEAGSCQIESWVAGHDANHALVLAPACGIAPGLELGADYTHSRHRDIEPHAAGLAIKWTPSSWATTTTMGDLAFGLKLSTGFGHPTGEGWRLTSTGLFGLASWAPREGWAVHLNLGAARDRPNATTATQVNLALVWEPVAQAVLFVEGQANNRREVYGGATRSAGARWWLRKDKLGLDLTTHRTSGGGSAWTVGLGWYGLPL